MTAKELRAASGMTQKAFADYFGVSVRIVESWEIGKRNCRDYVLALMEYKLRNEGIIRDE